MGDRSSLAAARILAAVAIGYPVQRHYLESRYADPTFTTPGLNAAFTWARDISDARIATTSTRQYPLFGTDLSNHVAVHRRRATPRRLRRPDHLPRLAPPLNEGDYDYVVTSRDRIEPGKPPTHRGQLDRRPGAERSRSRPRCLQADEAWIHGVP